MKIVLLYTATNIYFMCDSNDEVRNKICSFESLYDAMMECKRGVMWKPSTMGFVQNALANITKLKRSLDDCTYKISPYSCFKIYEPKERDIVSTKFRDRVFQRSLCKNYLYKKLTKGFIYDNVACQLGKGNEFGRKRLKTHLQRFYRKYGTSGYVLKLDIKNFFGSTSHHVAKQAVAKRVDNAWVREMVFNVIDSYDQGSDPNIGMGLGSELTQLIQLSVLDDLDHYIKEVLRIKYYIRYNDDMILISDCKSKLQTCRELIREELSKIGLTIHPKKTQIFKLSQNINFLGFRFLLTPTGGVKVTIIPSRISHERRKLKKLVHRANDGILTKEYVADCYSCWKSYAGNKHKAGTHGNKLYRNTHNLIIKLDQLYKICGRS